MTNLKDQIQEKIKEERERSKKPEQTDHRESDEARRRLNAIRSRLDELSHSTDKYSLKVSYVQGPYSTNIAVVELDNVDGIWVAMWHVAPTVGGLDPDWEVTYNPHGVETQRQWLRNSDDLFQYLSASIAQRIVEMEADEE